MNITALSLAQRYLGIAELGPGGDHPLIQWWLSLCGWGFNASDETAWCSAFVNGIAWELALERSKSARARSWLLHGEVVDPRHAQPGWDVVILKRGGGDQPGPDVIDAPGHVGFYAGSTATGQILVLGGNQSNKVSVEAFPMERVLGVRRFVTP